MIVARRFLDRLPRLGVVVAIVVAAAMLAACGKASNANSTTSKSSASTTATPKQGGSITELVSSSYGTWSDLDPAKDTEAVGDGAYYDAIYGNLFQQGPQGQIIPDLASSYKFADGGKQFILYLRHGVTFTDGTPFNAAAVAYNIRRDLEPKNACSCDLNFPVTSITTPSNYEVVLNLSKVYAPLRYAWFEEVPNWIYSPTALKKDGEKYFSDHPVGAGPFEVVTDKPASKLVLKANPNYWQTGRPYLSGLTFLPIGNDNSAYDALLTGQAQVYGGYSTLNNIKTVEKHLQVTQTPDGAGPLVLQLNTSVAPFNNITAREAIYYATNPVPIEKSLAAGFGTVDQGMGVPGGLYYEQHVPGYRTYNLAKAKAMVKQLGGLNVTLDTISLGTVPQVDVALKAEWAQAGITTTLNTYTLEGTIQQFHSNKWQAFLQTAGGFDPALGFGLAFRYESNSPFTGIHDPTLDAMINKAATILNPAAATAQYDAIWKYIAEKAYSPFLYTTPGFVLSAHKVKGPGVSTPSWGLDWQDLYVS